MINLQCMEYGNDGAPAPALLSVFWLYQWSFVYLLGHMMIQEVDPPDKSSWSNSSDFFGLQSCLLQRYALRPSYNIMVRGQLWTWTNGGASSLNK